MHAAPRLAAGALAAAWLIGHSVNLPAAQDPDRLREAALAFARTQLAGRTGEVQVEAGEVDRRLQLPPCDRLEAFLPAGTKLWGRSNVGVRCLGPEPWSLLVPITIRVMGDAVFTARPLVRGRPVEAADLEVRRVDLTGLPAGVLTEASQALERVPGTSIQAGLPLRAEMLRGATAVAAGQGVRILFLGDGFKVSSEGVALGNAATGDPVQVRAASGRVLRGVVTGPGVVEVR
jgi:flagella basal body P-ring formation protein FlgA